MGKLQSASTGIGGVVSAISLNGLGIVVGSEQNGGAGNCGNGGIGGSAGGTGNVGGAGTPGLNGSASGNPTGIFSADDDTRRTHSGKVPAGVTWFHGNRLRNGIGEKRDGRHSREWHSCLNDRCDGGGNREDGSECCCERRTARECGCCWNGG